MGDFPSGGTVERENESGAIRTDEKRVRTRGGHDYGSGEEVRCSPADGAGRAGKLSPGGSEAAGTRKPEVGSGEGIHRRNSDGRSESAEEAAAYGSSDLHTDWKGDSRLRSSGVERAALRAGQEAGAGSADERRDLRAAVVSVGRGRAGGLV